MHNYDGTGTATIAPTILAVDDGRDNRLLLDTILTNAGYTVLLAANGVEALEVAEQNRPDLILLDVKMPKMDGFETIATLQSMPSLAGTPVIFLSSRASLPDRVKGLKLGAVDYILKPIQMEDVLVRTGIHIKLRRLQLESLELNNELRELNREKDELLGIAAHDLKSPFSVISGFTELIMERFESDAFAKSDPAHDEISGFLRVIARTSMRSVELINSLLDLSEVEARHHTDSRTTTVDLAAIVRDVAHAFQQHALAKHIKVDIHVEDRKVLVNGDPQSLYQIIDNLVSNAIKYSPPCSSVSIAVNDSIDHVTFHVADEGAGITDGDRQHLFKKFAKLSARPTGGEPSNGLGLFIVKKLAEGLGGKVWCDSVPGKGSTFFVRFIRNAENSDV